VLDSANCNCRDDRETRSRWFLDHQANIWHVKVDFAGAPTNDCQAVIHSLTIVHLLA
jgi:hypothetical protein